MVYSFSRIKITLRGSTIKVVRQQNYYTCFVILKTECDSITWHVHRLQHLMFIRSSMVTKIEETRQAHYLTLKTSTLVFWLSWRWLRGWMSPSGAAHKSRGRMNFWDKWQLPSSFGNTLLGHWVSEIYHFCVTFAQELAVIFFSRTLLLLELYELII